MTIEKIKIEDFDSKNFHTGLNNPIFDGKAVITHYLHNIHNGVSKHYEKDALNHMKRFVEYKNLGLNDEKKFLQEDALQQLLFQVEDVPFPTPEKYTFKFIDLFAGVGGFRIAMQNMGGKCVYTSEWDKDAQKTYRENFGEIPFGDITKQQIKNYIPDNFDILCAGFPCQAFSIAGRRDGFEDTRGTLFFDVAEIINKHKPKVIFLENVKNLVTHDKGKTFKVIIDTLEKKLGYKVFSKVLNSMTHANIPQNRERIFIVAFDPKQVKNYKTFLFPKEIELTKTIHDIIEKETVIDSDFVRFSFHVKVLT